MKVLVTGRDGQLGRSLARLAPRIPEIDVAFIGRDDADLSIPGAIACAIAEARPDLVINAAAYTAVDRAENEPGLARRINADAAGEAAEAAARFGAAIVQISTDYVFDGEAGRPYREDDPVGPLNVYGETKLAGEEQVSAANPRHLILRTSWVVSPFGRNFVSTMLRIASEREEIAVVADQRGSPTSALDLAEAILEIARRWRTLDPSGTFHLAGAGEASWAELAATIMEAAAGEGLAAAAIKRIGTAAYPTPARRPAYTVLDCGAARAALGVSLPAWRDSIRTIVAELGRPPTR